MRGAPTQDGVRDLGVTALIDSARRRKPAKRPLFKDRLNPTEVASALAGEVAPDALEEALERPEGLDPRQARMVEMRFFVGLTAAQIGAALDMSPSTVQHEWRLARAWPQCELEPS